MSPRTRRSARWAWQVAIACAAAAAVDVAGHQQGAPPAAAASPGAAQPAPQPEQRYEPTDAYEQREIQGWPLRVNKRLLAEHPDLARDVLKEVSAQLYLITRHVPLPAVEKLRKVTIWVELNEPHHQCMAYHPDTGWLRDNGMNPAKAKCVELANARTFINWVHRQPWMILHELAHAYHNQFLPDGFENGPVLAAYRNARASKRYDHVLHHDGLSMRAYAMNNQMEYFAEASEAMFGANDFFPFVRAELRAHDPNGFDALREAWGVVDAK